MDNSTVIWGAIFACIAIILGAFGAHALKAILSDVQLISFNTGVRYQFWMALALLILGFNSNKFNSIKTIKIFWIIGIICFSFSIYLLNLLPVIGINTSFIGPITPLGGALLIIGWIAFIVQVTKKSKD